MASTMGAQVLEPEEFETNQTVVAAWLAYCGHTIHEAVWEDDVCTFFFTETEDLLQDFGTYLQGKARVEPGRFSQQYGQVMQLIKRTRR